MSSISASNFVLPQELQNVNLIFDEQFYFDALEAKRQGEQFPIDLDFIWKPLGYFAKNEAKRRLIKVLDKNFDFSAFGLKSPNGGRPSEDIRLSIEGFKHFCMLAETLEGKRVRKYFIDIEEAYRQHLERSMRAAYDESPERVLSYDEVYEHLNDSIEELFELRKEVQILRKNQKVIAGAPIPSKTGFTHDLDELWKVSGIKYKHHLVKVLKKHFTRDIHYKVILPQTKIRSTLRTTYLMTHAAYHCLLAALRSQVGVDTSRLPEHLVLDVDLFFSQSGKKNTRLGNSR